MKEIPGRADAQVGVGDPRDPAQGPVDRDPVVNAAGVPVTSAAAEELAGQIVAPVVAVTVRVTTVAVDRVMVGPPERVTIVIVETHSAAGPVMDRGQIGHVTTVARAVVAATAGSAAVTMIAARVAAGRSGAIAVPAAIVASVMTDAAMTDAAMTDAAMTDVGTTSVHAGAVTSATTVVLAGNARPVASDVQVATVTLAMTAVVGTVDQVATAALAMIAAPMGIVVQAGPDGSATSVVQERAAAPTVIVGPAVGEASVTTAAPVVTVISVVTVVSVVIVVPEVVVIPEVIVIPAVVVTSGRTVARVDSVVPHARGSRRDLRSVVPSGSSVNRRSFRMACNRMRTSHPCRKAWISRCCRSRSGPNSRACQVSWRRKSVRI